MRRPILLLALLAVPVSPVLAQGFPGATVGIPLGKPDPFGAMARRPAESMADPFAEPSTGGEATRPERRLRSPSRGHLKGHDRAAPKRRPPLARR
ncbi:hypothetical protein [Methylobacterium sp. R2-1]|uniref:hypothetical protein n=1 Tax=Methylobacterium sp. R2-1 TaxID=2587064 RepID=UPI001609BB86|nr:hypothetical protein [Methylobacterium sp. R2-1]MBB2963858.1 hypothetical protein [Methylobacterium sp. R2-1]